MKFGITVSSCLATLVLACQFISAGAVLAQETRESGEVETLDPVGIARRGDYEIEYYTLHVGDHVRFRIRGVYRVERIAEDSILLVPVSERPRVFDFDVPVGRIAIGNRHTMVLREPDVEAGTASIAIEYKVRWHWWDAFGF